MWSHENFDGQTGDFDDPHELAPSAAVAIELSEVLDKDVTEIEPLGHRIDTDALNRLFQRNRATDFRFEFTHEGCQIEVYQNEISVSRLDEASD